MVYSSLSPLYSSVCPSFRQSLRVVTTTRSPALSPDRISTISPNVAPTRTGVSRTRFPSRRYADVLPFRSIRADRPAARRGFISSGASARGRKETLALMSGSIRRSLSRKRTLTRTVALLRSTVGTMAWTSPRNRVSGRASNWMSQGWPTRMVVMLVSQTSTSTCREFMSAIDTTAALALAADPMGVTMSPMSAFLVKTTASKGARIRV